MTGCVAEIREFNDVPPGSEAKIEKNKSINNEEMLTNAGQAETVEGE
jgi:hypothetical protein